jgi:DEAD/DEAH box helicase domain-containing protein
MSLTGCNIIVLDLEIVCPPETVPGGWENLAGLGLSLGAWWDYQTSRIVWFDRQNLAESIGQLLDRLPLLVTFNGRRFDLALMQAVWMDADRLPFDHPEVRAWEALCAAGCDLLQAVWAAERQGGRVMRGVNSLDALCAANGLGAKTGTGAEAPRWWAEGQVARVANYCQHDVYLTRDLLEYALAHDGWLTRRDDRLQIALPLALAGVWCGT